MNIKIFNTELSSYKLLNLLLKLKMFTNIIVLQ